MKTKKPIECMSAAEINKALDKNAKLSSQLADEFIAAGRGHERPSEIHKMSDPLAQRHIALANEHWALLNEVHRRAGSKERRLPHGFGPLVPCEENPSKTDQARRLYRRFHQFDPKREAEYDLRIPETVFHVGEAKQVLYRSDKFNPESGEDEGVIDYFHDHEGGVRFHLTQVDEDEPYKEVNVPYWIQKAKAVTVLGKCLGFSYQDFENIGVNAKGVAPLPELCALPPDGKCLLVVQNKRSVIAIIWGGDLKVKPEGIVG